MRDEARARAVEEAEGHDPRRSVKETEHDAAAVPFVTVAFVRAVDDGAAAAGRFLLNATKALLLFTLNRRRMLPGDEPRRAVAIVDDGATASDAFTIAAYIRLSSTRGRSRNHRVQRARVEFGQTTFQLIAASIISYIVVVFPSLSHLSRRVGDSASRGNPTP